MVKLMLITPMAICKAGLAACLLADGRPGEALAFALVSVVATYGWAQLA